jgi:hypothetical protein
MLKVTVSEPSVELPALFDNAVARRGRHKGRKSHRKGGRR